MVCRLCIKDNESVPWEFVFWKLGLDGGSIADTEPFSVMLVTARVMLSRFESLSGDIHWRDLESGNSSSSLDSLITVSLAKIPKFFSPP